MKPSWIAALALGASAGASAQQAPVPAWLNGLARSDYGCEVLLCLANPQGPRAVAQCVPPINRLMRDLARGRGFPTCNMARTSQGSAYATPTGRPYDPCPAGTTALQPGQYAALVGPGTVPPASASGARSLYGSAGTGLVYGGIGEGDGYAHGNYGGDNGPPPAKVCVGGYQGDTVMGSGDNAQTVGNYSTIYVQNAAPSTMAIDVYINDQHWQTVRW